MTNKDAIEKLGYIKNQYHILLNFYDYDDVFDIAIKALENERPQGEWLDIYSSHIAYKCSCCGVQMPITDLFNYCPNCGAYMQKEAET